jgi:dTDP-4-amino-4,6-dideoxy-D-galactose acyltransferase
MERAAAIASRWPALTGLWPYGALRQVGWARALEQLAQPFLLGFGRQPGQHVLCHGPVEVLYADLAWDSAYFGLPTVRLHAALFSDEVGRHELVTALAELAKKLRAAGVRYIYAEVAATDPRLLGALGASGWSVVETRLHYHHERLDALPPELPVSPVRAAMEGEAEVLRSIAATNSNSYDRFHADPAFNPGQADAFLGEYAAAAVRGYCDIVLVPAEETLDSFMALSYLKDVAAQLSLKLGRVVLTAVGAGNRGWHRRLLTEALRHTAARGGTALLMTTQATNQAVIHNAERMGMCLGSTTHIVSCQL